MILYIDLGTVEIKVYKKWFRKLYILKRYLWQTREVFNEDSPGTHKSWYRTLHTKTIINEEEFQKLRNTSWSLLWKEEKK